MYHLVLIPKYRQKGFYGRLCRWIGPIWRMLCDQRGVEPMDGHAMPNFVHMCLGIPPKYSVAHSVGFLKGRSAVRIHRELMGPRRMFGLHSWATGYWGNTVGADEEKVRKYVREQEHLESGQGDPDVK